MKLTKKFLLENNDTDYEDLIEEFMGGECIPFTTALCDIFPEYQVAVLLDEKTLDEDEEVEFDFDFVHAFCYKDNNPQIIIDARGVRKLKELYDEFYDINPIIEYDIPNTKYLIDNYAGKEFYSSETYDYDEYYYKKALELIKKDINNYKT